MQTIGWFGAALTVPDDWNVRFASGDERQGALQLADMRAIRLELRWRTARKPGKVVASLVKSLEKRSGVQALQKSARGIDYRLLKSEKITAALAGAEKRVFELLWPTDGVDAGKGPQPEHVEGIAEGFAASLAALGEEEWRWAVYGVDARVPRRYRLEKWEMLPGRTSLRFADPRVMSVVRHTRRLTVGSFSMAERLLAKEPLVKFAIRALDPPGVAKDAEQWEVSAGKAEIEFVRRHRVLFWSRHRLVVTHERDANRIGYRHSIVPA